MHVADLDRYRAGGSGPPAVVLGYGNITDALVPQAVAVLAGVVAEHRTVAQSRPAGRRGGGRTT